MVKSNPSPDDYSDTNQNSPRDPSTTAEIPSTGAIANEEDALVELNTDTIDSNQFNGSDIYTNQDPSSNPSSNQGSCPNSNQASNSDTIIDSTAATDEEKNDEDKNIEDDMDSKIDECEYKDMKAEDLDKNEDDDSKKSDETAENKCEGKSKDSAEGKAEAKEVSNVKANGHSNGKPSDKSLNYYKSLSGKIRKFGSSYVFKQENIKSYTDTFGIDYKIGDHVYMDINKPNQPFAIACVLDFKLVIDWAVFRNGKGLLYQSEG